MHERWRIRTWIALMHLSESKCSYILTSRILWVMTNTSLQGFSYFYIKCKLGIVESFLSFFVLVICLQTYGPIPHKQGEVVFLITCKLGVTRREWIIKVLPNLDVQWFHCYYCNSHREKRGLSSLHHLQSNEILPHLQNSVRMFPFPSTLPHILSVTPSTLFPQGRVGINLPLCEPPQHFVHVANKEWIGVCYEKRLASLFLLAPPFHRFPPRGAVLGNNQEAPHQGFNHPEAANEWLSVCFLKLEKHTVEFTSCFKNKNRHSLLCLKKIILNFSPFLILKCITFSPLFRVITHTDLFCNHIKPYSILIVTLSLTHFLSFQLWNHRGNQISKSSSCYNT